MPRLYDNYISERVFPEPNALQIKPSLCHKIIDLNKYFNFTTSIPLPTLHSAEEEEVRRTLKSRDVNGGCMPVTPGDACVSLAAQK